MFRSGPPEVFSKRDDLQALDKPTGEQRRRSAVSTNRFATLLKLYPGTDTPLKTPSTSVEHSPPGEHFQGTHSASQKNLKRFNFLRIIKSFYLQLVNEIY